MFIMIPAVFAVDGTYQIMVRREKPALMLVKVGDKCYYDHSNGVLRSDTKIHRMTVPMEVLDRVGEYTICEREMINRKPYFPQTGEVKETVYKFYPVKNSEKIRAYHIADSHNAVMPPVAALKAYGDIDFLILNGDIVDCSADIECFDKIYEICGRITQGNIPIVFARGNHDLRGEHAEKLEHFTPTRLGKSYFTVKLGGFWAIILDCGEDKDDSIDEYGNTICCHEFRKEEMEFIKDVVNRGEYNDSDIFCKAVIVHQPFNRKCMPPFDIEDDIYNEWMEILRKDIQPDIMICGHTHQISLDMPGGEMDYRNQPCTVAVMSQTDYKSYFAGAGFEFSKNKSILITVTDSNGKILNEFEV